MRLAAKLSLLLGAASAVPLLVATAITLPKNQAALTGQLAELYQKSAAALAGETNQALADKIEALSLASHALPFHTLSPEEREQALLLVYRQTKGASIAGLFDASGDAVAAPVYFSTTPDGDRDGHETVNDVDLAAYAGAVPLKAAIDAGIAVGPVYVGADSTGQPIPRVAVALAVAGAKRGEKWVLAVEISLRTIADRFSAFRLGKHGQAFLVDGGGRIVAAKNPALILARTEHASVAGKRARGATADVPLVGWTVKVEQPDAEALLPIRRQMQTAGLALAVSLLVAFVAGLTTVRAVTKPVARLREAAAAVAAGKLSAEVAIKGKDELAELGVSFNTMTRGLRERERLRATFSRYVSDEIAQRVLAESSDGDLKGELVEVTVLFMDLRGFTTLSERCTPRQVVDILNAYFDVVVRVVAKYQGVINKFMGDAVMAFFGVPKAIPDPERRALQAALEIRKELFALNQRRAEAGELTAEFGIGINTGQAIAGNVGGQERLEYTVIGDAVNVASRLQTQAAGNEVVASGSTVARVQGAFQLESRGDVKVKGREQAVAMYLIVG
ncbi:MAG: HAMP domain-containing protein [Deltaproteobacteria bacterium]|nr:HAMP domain-containing protein [Deltaproteobacteria bacterium]